MRCQCLIPLPINAVASMENVCNIVYFLIVGEIFETAVLNSGRTGDDSSFDRNFALLMPYYLDIRSQLPASQREPLIWGFYLLMLLVQNRIAEFHAAVELLPKEIVCTPEVTHVMELEGWMMQGAYEKVSSAQKAPVSPYYLPLLERIVTTVRHELASCSEAAYESLNVEDAMRLLRLGSMEEVKNLCEEYGWRVEGDTIILKKSEGESSMDCQRLST